MNREELIQICKDSVVPLTEWKDRDSYSAQVGVSDIYAGLMVGLDYEVKIDNDTIWIYFTKPTDEQLSEIYKHNLEIGKREDWFKWYINEHNEEPDSDEMFDCNGMNWKDDYLSGYLPTRERLVEVNGGDWY